MAGKQFTARVDSDGVMVVTCHCGWYMDVPCPVDESETDVECPKCGEVYDIRAVTTWKVHLRSDYWNGLYVGVGEEEYSPG